MTGRVTVRLVKPGKGETVQYEGVVLRRSESSLLVHARWERPRLELPYIAFEPGDHFFEHYFFDAYFSIFEVREESGKLKGWYCNICRPARLEGERLVSEDLELDLFVSRDRQRILTLDEDEFAAQTFDEATAKAAREALALLVLRAERGSPPFDGSDAKLSLGLEP